MGAQVGQGLVDFIEQARKHPDDIDANDVALKEMSKLGKSKDDRLQFLEKLFPVFDQAFEAYRKQQACHDVMGIGLRAVAGGGEPNVKGTRDRSAVRSTG